MPICKREGFDVLTSRKKDETFHDNDEVFFCEITKEIFREYEDYFRHVMVINSTVWQCEVTGRDNLTYAEALKSERRAREKMEQFKDVLRPPVVLIIEQAKQSSLKTLLAITSKFLRKRYFMNEEVTACYKATTYYPYTVIDILPPVSSSQSNASTATATTAPMTEQITSPPPVASPNVVYEDTENIRYKLRRIGKNPTEVIVPFKNIRRRNLEFNQENLQMFVKDNVVRVDGILRPKPDSYKKYIIERKLTFSKIFIGKIPRFTPAKMKPRLPLENGKKQSTINKYLGKHDDEESIARREETKKAKKLKAEKEKASLMEEMERVRREKQEKLAELERQKAEKRMKLMQKIEADCVALLTKTDDLERTDQKLLPMYAPIQTYIPIKLLGDAFMTAEFLATFENLLSGIDVFRGKLTFYELSRALTTREIVGPLSDILLILLGTIFELQKEEEDECSVDYLLLRKEVRQREPFITMSQASRAHFFSKRHFFYKINELPLDAFTLSEVMRLHLLSSGACVKEKVEKWRLMYRNGYTSSEDPGLLLRIQHPHIIRALKMYTIYQLPFFDVMRIIRCLMSQILTYSSPINVIEDRMEQMAKSRNELRTLSVLENRRLANVQTQKRSLTIEHNQQCLTDEVRNSPEKKAQLEEKLNKKISDLMAHSERERKKYDQQVDQLQSALFNFLVFLGMDRAYRKYYVLESIPGIFVEHSADCMDTCLEEPPKNDINLNDLLTANVASMPKNRKDLRTYLFKLYTQQEKDAQCQPIPSKQPAKLTPTTALENKENHENGLVNGLTNGHDHAAVNGIKIDIDEVEPKIETPTESNPPSQYELFMCTGDKRNCIVHDERNTDRQRWAYLYKEEDIDALIAALNPLGERESQLREQLTALRPLIVRHTSECPTELLSVPSKQLMKFKSTMLTETHRKYGKANLGYPEGCDLNEVMNNALIDRIMQFDHEIYSGNLGQVRVKDLNKWRKDLQEGNYDAQCKLQWGPAPQKLTSEVADEDIDDMDDDEGADIREDGGKYANKPFSDPGEGLGDTIDIDSEDSGDDAVSLHDSATLRVMVKNLASALLQVEQGIERRFLKEPFGVAMKELKDKELLERKIKCGANRLKQWEVSLMESTSFAQIFLHLSILHDSILWARSTNKSFCQVCRRGSDPDKMLLCDECNGGTHMFCMKPKMKTVPEGNWYCQRCVKRLGITNEDESKKKATQKRKRTFVMEEEETLSDTSSTLSGRTAKNNNNNNNNNNNSNTDRRERSTRTRHRLKSTEIEKIFEENEDAEEEADDEDENADEDDDVENEVAEDECDGDEDGEDVDGESDEDMDDAEEASTEQHRDGEEDVDDESSNDEDADSVCNVCSYEGSDIICVRCKNTFHMECLNLKRPPRYNFICPSCKIQDDKKRKVKELNVNRDDDDSESSYEPTNKRTRYSRGSLRSSLPNGGGHTSINDGNTSKTGNSSSRRSHRRNGEDLPLNSPLLYELLDDIMKHKHSWPFLRPVLQSEVPDYYEIIKKPMDFAKVKSKLNTGEYQMNEELMKDIQLVFQNCDHYNVKGNEVYKAGCKLEKFVMERCKVLNLPFTPSDMNG